MKTLVMHRKVTLSMLVMMVLIYGLSGVSYSEDALTILDTECEADGVQGIILSVTLKGTVRANRDVEDVRGWLTINGRIISAIPKEYGGGKSLGDLSAGQTKSFSITEPVAGQGIVGGRCGYHIEFREVNPPQPDLVIQSIQSDKNTLAPGESFTLSATVRNSGDGRASSTTLRYYRSTNATISSSDTEVGTDSVSALEANRTGAESISLSAPTSPGTYYYGACVDSVTDESDADNNCSLGVRVTVTAPQPTPRPDLADVNGDGTVNILDLVSIASSFGQTGETAADINGDGAVNILDLVLAAGAIGNDAASPPLHTESIGMLTSAEVKQWLSQAQQLALADLTSQRGILFLEQLLAAMVPKETLLLANYPNPFNPETWIPYQLSKPAAVMITIYASNGHVVRQLALGHQPAGVYQSRSRAAYWDGKNAVGEPVASGVYFYTLTAGEFSATRKMLIRK